MTTQFPLSGPMSVGDLLDRAFRLYRARFGLFLLTAAIFLVPFEIISALVLEAIRVGLFDGNDPVGSNELVFFTDLAANAVLTVLNTLTAGGVVTLALTVQCSQSLHGSTLTVGQSVRRGLRRFWSHLGLMIVIWAVLLIVTAIAIVSIIAGLIALEALFHGFLTEMIWDTWIENATSYLSYLGASLLVLFIFALCALLALAPSIYLSARWLTATAALVAEQTGPFGSLGRSWRLSRKNVRRIIGYLLLLLAVMTIVITIPTALFQWILFDLLPPFPSLELTRVISGTISTLFYVIGTPFYTAAVVLLYYDLRIRKESYDLELRVAELEQRVAREADWEQAAVEASAGRAG